MRPVMAHRLRTTAVAFVDVHLLVLTVDGDLDRVFPLVSELPVPYFILTFAAHVGDFFTVSWKSLVLSCSRLLSEAAFGRHPSQVPLFTQGLLVPVAVSQGRW